MSLVSKQEKHEIYIPEPKAITISSIIETFNSKIFLEYQLGFTVDDSGVKIVFKTSDSYWYIIPSQRIANLLCMETASRITYDDKFALDLSLNKDQS